MTKADDSTRRGIAGPLVGGAVAVAALFLGGAFITAPRMERSLASDARRALGGVGVDEDVAMSGQNATLRCGSPLAAADVAVQAVAGVKGIRSVTLDPSCSGATATSVDPSPVPTSAPVTSVPPTTVPATATSTSAPTTTAASTTTTAPSAAPVVSVRLAFGRLVLAGKVGSTNQRDLIAYVVGHAVADGNLTVQLTVDPTVTIDDAVLGRLGTVALAMPVNLASGTAGIVGSKVTVLGVFTDDTHRAAFEQIVRGAGAESQLVLRPNGSAADAAKLQHDMNTLVDATPIVYKKGATDIAPESRAVIEQLAGLAKQFGGLHIEVQGHTDSQGNAARNLVLSQRRAQVALDAMVALGVPAADLSARGFGETHLLTDQNGKEIPAKSRRVVFGVSAR
jgi:outer membrane protein OmpA-like peptidoglycan-associated protein